LTKLSDNGSADGFQFFGVVKETGVDDEGLLDFYENYYSFPLYRDVNLTFYKALGDRKIKIPWRNPWKLIKGLLFVRRAAKRIKQKEIDGNLIGEGLTKGGVIIFGPDGAPKYAYAEESLNEMPIEDIVAAMEAVKQKS